MSHFSVLVIGDDVDRQLKPFHEYESTGTNDEYVQDIDVTEECREHGLDWHCLEDKTVTDEAQIDRNGEHKWGYAIVDKQGKLLKAVNRTNPNRKWDWYEVGGRYAGHFTVKPGVSPEAPNFSWGWDEASMREVADGRHADSVRKGDVDADAMMADAEKRARERWAFYSAAIAGTPESEPWASFTKRVDAEEFTIEQAREQYHAQPRVKALRSKEAMDKIGWDASPEDFPATEDEYVRRARADALSTFAVLHNGQWHERGNMGWWGIVSNEKEAKTWEDEFMALWDSLPDDTLLTVVDCHI